MFGALDISTSALVAQRQRMTAISANMALRPVAVDPNSNDQRQLGVMMGEITGHDSNGEQFLISDPFP